MLYSISKTDEDFLVDKNANCKKSHYANRQEESNEKT